MDKSCRTCARKASPRSLFYFDKQPKTVITCKKFFERYFVRELLKTLKKLTLFFLSNPIPFNGQSYQKQKGPGTSDQSLFRLRNKFTKISLLVIYDLTKFDGVI